MSERTEGNEMCLLCGEPRAEHLKSPADWRTVPGCTGMFRKVSEPSGTTGPAPPYTLEQIMEVAQTDVVRARGMFNASVKAQMRVPEGTTGPADAPKEETHKMCDCNGTTGRAGSTASGNAEGSTPVGTWQPIETAPQDGTEIWLTDGNWKRSGWWARRTGNWSVDTAVSLKPPTHWAPMPLPTPPEAQ